MSLYRIKPPQPPQQRSQWLITTVLLLIVLLLAIALWFFSRGDIGLRLASTPTPSATPATPPTATPDFRSTMIYEDQITQIAYLATVTRQTPEVINVPVVMGGADETATALSIQMPIVGGSSDVTAPDPILTPDPNLGVAPTPTTLPNIELPTPDLGVNPDSPVETPTVEGPQVPIVIDTETPTPTETPILLPTDTPTATSTPLPTVFLVDGLNALIALAPSATTVWLRLAPANTQTPVATLNPGVPVRLRGRDTTGEWVYICCAADGQQRWVRQANALPKDNPTPTNAPPSTTPDDVRWLPTQPWPANQPQPPAVTPVPADDYPMLRRDRANTAQVPTAFNGALQLIGSGGTTGQLTTPVIVSGPYVLVVSADRNLYGLNREALAQQYWKYTVGMVNQPMLFIDNIIYYIESRSDGTSVGVAVEFFGTGPLWSVPLSVPNGPQSAVAVTGFVASGNRLFVGVNASGAHFVVQVDRERGGPINAFPLGGTQPRPFAIGNQLLYVGGERLWALDVDNLELVWVRDLLGVTTPPVYAERGVLALAELYAATNDGSIHALDADTGLEIHTYDGNKRAVTGLAYSDTAVFVIDNNFIRAFERRSRGLLWNTPINGSTVSGPIVTPGKLILVFSNGTIQLVDPGSGVVVSVGSVPQSVSNAAAVSGPYLFVPSDNGSVYGFTQ